MPIPEPGSRPRPQTVRLQDVLTAHQRAIEERIDEGLRQMRETVAEITRQAAAEIAGAARPAEGPAQRDLGRSVLAHADEGFQTVRLRLERVEEVLRRLAAMAQRTPPDAARNAEATASLARAIGALAEQQRGVLSQLVEAQRRALAGLAEAQRAVEDLADRTGRGVVAVARVLQRDIEEIKTSIRSLHRTLAWEGLAHGGRLEGTSVEDGT